MRLGWLFVFVLAVISSEAATISSTGAGGNWNVGGTWVGGAVPLATDNAIIVNGATVNLTTNQTIVNLTLNGNGILNFNTNTRTLTVNGTMTMNGTSSVIGNANSRILSLQGNFNVPAGQSVSVGGVRISQIITGTFNLAGTFTPTDNTGTKTFGNANFFDGCLIDATVTEGITIAGNLSVLPGTPGLHSRVGRVTMTVMGTTLVTGYFEFANSGTGQKTFNNTITVAAGGTWDNIVGEDPIINCSIVNDGVWPQPTGGNGRYDVNVVGTYTYSGTRTIAFTRLRIQSASTVTNSGSLLLTQTANSALTVNSGGIFNNGDGLTPATLTFTAYTDVVNLGGGGSVVNFANALNTVVYAAPTNDQNAYPTTYYDMTCNGDNTVFVNGTTTVNNTLTIDGTTTVDVTGGTDLNGTGSLVMNGSSLLRISSAGTVPAMTGASNALAAGTTIELYRAGAQTAANGASFPYQHVIISGNAGSAVNLDAVSNIAGDLTVSNAGSFNNTAATPPLITVVGAFSYGSTATTTLNTNLTATSVSISGTGGFTYSNRTITLDQNGAFWAVTGAPVITAAGTAQVLFMTGTNQEIGGSTNPSFNTLVIDNSSDVTLNISQATVTGTLTLTSGRLITGSNTVVMASGSTVTRTSGFVEGNLNKTFALGTSTRTFEVGTNTSYTPASITCTSVSTSGSLTVTSTEGDHPDIYSGLIEPNNTVNRYWSLTNVSIVFSAFSTGRIGGTLSWAGADEDASLDNTAILKWYNNTTLSWTGSDQFDDITEQNPAMTVATSIAANSCTFAIMNPIQLPTGQKVDFQVGEKIDPTFVYNRLTGPNNWNNLATWIQQRSGVITLTNGSPTITGSSTSFQSELQVGDVIMLITSPGTTYTVTFIDPLFQILTVAPAPAVSASAGYGRQYIPGINPPTSDIDAVVIGNTNLADLATTITLDIDAQILTLDVGSLARATAQILTHQNSTRDLTVLANATVVQPGGNVTNTWNINDAIADVQGDVTLGSNNNNVLRISRINITTGTLGAGALKFRAFNSAGREVQTVLAISGAGTVNLHGALTFNGNRGTLTSAAGSTFNYDRTASTQTIAQPSGSVASWVYANVHSNNTSAAGANWGFTSTGTSVTGNVRVQTGLMTVAGVNIIGAAGSTFQVADGATFQMLSASGAGNGGFPSGFGTFSLGATSIVKYDQTGNTNPWPIAATTYGHLIVGQNGSIRNFEVANATTTVAGDLTVGSGTSTPTLRGTGTATLNVTGNLLINANATLDASNISNLNLGGNWTDDGTFTSGSNTVRFNSPAANVLQTIGGTVSETFNNLTLNTSAGTDIVRLINDATVNNNLVLTLGGLELNGNTLIVSNSATTAIARTSGYIKSENTAVPYGTIRWFINNTTGAHVYPFGVSSTQYIPFTLNVTVAGARGVGTGFVPVSTYATSATNPPGEYPAGVTNLNGTTGGASVTDRYWNITLGSAEFAVTRPTSTVTFTALNTEKPTTWTAIGEPPTNPNFLLTQRWNTAAYWDPAQVAPAQTYANNSPAAGTFQVGVPSVTNYSTSWTITDSSVPLPVELVSFTAELRNGLVEIKWTTESELDNDFFTVQRTSNGESFEELTEVDGAGTSTQIHRYTAYDQQPLPGKWYYRVRQTDFNGSHGYSKLVSVEVPESYYRTVYPNPGNGDQVNVSVSPGDIGKNAEVWISDQSGRDVYRSARFVVSSRDIQVGLTTRLSSGMYVLSLVMDNEVKRFKLVVR